MRDDEFDTQDLEVDAEMRALLRELDYDDRGPSPELRQRTLDAVRAAPTPEVRAARAATRRRIPRPAFVGSAVAVAAAAAVALVVVLGGGAAEPDRTLALAGTDGNVQVEIRGGDVQLKGDGASLPAGTVYELWTVQGDSKSPKLTSAGTFRPSKDGTVDTELTLPAGTPKNAVLAVTREADSDPKPNLPPVLASA